MSLFLTLLLAISTISAHPESYSASGEVIMFWNLENFFNPSDDPETDDDDFTPGGKMHWTWDRYNTKKDIIAKAMLSVKDFAGDYPLCIGVCEVEDYTVLKKLLEETALSKLGYRFIMRPTPDRRGINVALLYRQEAFEPLAVNALTVNMPKGKRPTRNILYVKGVNKSSRDTLHIFTLHWPSKSGGEAESMPGRMAAANTVTHTVDSLMAAESSPKIILMGDFNDTPGSEPLTAVEASGLKDLSRPLAAKGKGTLKYQGVWECIDHFMISDNLSERCDMEIYSPVFLSEEDTKFLGSKPFRTYLGPVYHRGVSDHYPIILKILQDTSASARRMR